MKTCDDEQTMVTVSYEYMDGSCGEYQCPHDEAVYQGLADPTMRVWIDGLMVQRGFIAADEK